MKVDEVFQDWYDRAISKYQWMTVDQFECYRMLCDLYHGSHHLHGKLHEWGAGIRFNSTYNVMSTYDGDMLTRAVLLAHKRLIRFGIVPSGPGMLGLVFHKRKYRDGGNMWNRHPTIQDHIKILGFEHSSEGE